MRTLRTTNAYLKDLRRELRGPRRDGLQAEVTAVINVLLSGKPLDKKYKDHALNGEWKGYQDCHIRPDLVLIYKVTKTEVCLARLGSHSELF